MAGSKAFGTGGAPHGKRGALAFAMMLGVSLAGPALVAGCATTAEDVSPPPMPPPTPPPPLPPPPPPPPPPPRASETVAAQASDDDRLFHAVSGVDTQRAYAYYLTVYPRGDHAEIATARLQFLHRQAGGEGYADLDALLDSACEYGRLASFDWPPPEPSARVVVPSRIARGTLGDTPPLGDIADRLTSALSEAGYLEYGFQSIGCDGFALVTRLERIDETGRPLDDDVRFRPPGEDEPWTLTGYLSRLFYAPPGRWRQIVFAVTDLEFDEDRVTQAPSVNEADEMMREADVTTLPAEFDVLKWTGNHELHALIYEFEKGPGSRDVVRNLPSAIIGLAHLRGAGLYQRLQESGDE